MNRALVIAGVIIALVLCLAVLVVIVAAAGIFYVSRSSAASTAVVAVTLAAPPPTATRPAPTATLRPGETPPPSPTPLPSATTDAAVLSMLREIEQQVVEMRGLQPQGEFQLEFPTNEEYREITIEDFQTDYSPEEAQDDNRLYAALGLLPDGYDLYTLYVDLYSENILGSYDAETKEMYVLQASGKIGGIERQTYAHEYTHALQDQNYGLEALGLSDEGCEQDSEGCLAVRGLVEGDALLLDTLWLEQFGTQQDYQDISDFYTDYTSPSYNRSPCFLRDDFYWPYDDGLRFVQSLYDSGGWDAVNEAYANPPQSSEQVMHPALYHAGDVPEILPSIALTETLGSGWRFLDANVMGEWYTRLILLDPFRDLNPASGGYCSVGRSDREQMEEAAAGWGGDTYAAYYNDALDKPALALFTTWDTSGDAVEFGSAFERYGDVRFGGPSAQRGGGLCWTSAAEGESCFFRRDTDTLWVLAPDAATVDAIVQAIPPFAGQ